MKGQLKTDHFEMEGVCRYAFSVVHKLPKGGNEWRISSEWTRFKQFFALHEVGWSNRRIARELGIHRTTVAGYLEGRGDSKPTKVPTGSEGESDEADEGCRSLCVPYLESIMEKLSQGLSAQRIFQDLREEHDFGHGYDSVKRPVRHLRGARTLPFRRTECLPGDEAQVEFDTGTPLKGCVAALAGRVDRHAERTLGRIDD